MAISQQKSGGKMCQNLRALFSVEGAGRTRGISAMYDKTHRAPIDVWTPPTETPKSTPATRAHVGGGKQMPRPRQPFEASGRSHARATQPSPLPSPRKQGHAQKKQADDFFRNRPGPYASYHRGAGRQLRSGNQQSAIRRNPSTGKTFAEEATSPEWRIQVPRLRPRGYERYSANSAVLMSLDSSHKHCQSTPAANMARLQQATATDPSGHSRPSRVLTVIRSNCLEYPEIVPGDSASSSGCDEDFDTPLAEFLPLQKYQLYVAAHDIRIVKPLLNTQADRMGRVNQHPVRISRAPSVRSQKAQLLKEEVLEYYNAITAPIHEHHPISVDERCIAFLNTLDPAPQPSPLTTKPASKTTEAPHPAAQRNSKAPARYRRFQQPVSQKQTEVAQAGENNCETKADAKSNDFALIGQAHDSVLGEGWSSELLDSLNEIGTTKGKS